MDASHNIVDMRLTSSEIGELWTTYMTDSASKCVLSYFISNTNSPTTSNK